MATFSVSAKNFKRAVDRNRIKRKMREAYRLQKSSLQKQLEQNHQHLAVFIIFTGKSLPEFESVFEKMGFIILQLVKLISKD
jgi:ribonuclease P protein component